MPKNPPEIIPFGPRPNLYIAPVTKPPTENSKTPDLSRNLDITVLNALKKETS